MLDARINTVPLWYALYSESAPAVDENGDYTGESSSGYGDPVKIRANLSPARGREEDDIFGASLNYNKTITTARMNLGIDEHTLIWDSDPGEDADPSTAKYRVVGVAKGHYHMRYALRQIRQEGD